MKVQMHAAALAVTLAVAGGAAQAALVGVLQSYPDVTLITQPTLIYDHNAINANTGLLLMVAGGSALKTSASAQVTQQSYLGAGDSRYDAMLSFAVDNTTGQLVANSTWNKVTIGSGNVTGSNWTFSWQGTISQFGFDTVGSTNFFDARWVLNSDTYGAVPSNLSATFFNGALSGRSGGIKFNSTGTTAQLLTGNMWGYDWMRGLAAGSSGATYSAFLADFVGNTRLAAYQSIDIAQTANRAATTVTADVFVPLPAPLLLFTSGLIAVAAPLARRRAAAAA